MTGDHPMEDGGAGLRTRSSEEVLTDHVRLRRCGDLDADPRPGVHHVDDPDRWPELTDG